MIEFSERIFVLVTELVKHYFKISHAIIRIAQIYEPLHVKTMRGQPNYFDPNTLSWHIANVSFWEGTS